jgi:hypothetical protein
MGYLLKLCKTRASTCRPHHNRRFPLACSQSVGVQLLDVHDVPAGVLDGLGLECDCLLGEPLVNQEYREQAFSCWPQWAVVISG